MFIFNMEVLVGQDQDFSFLCLYPIDIDIELGYMSCSSAYTAFLFRRSGLSVDRVHV